MVVVMDVPHHEDIVGQFVVRQTGTHHLNELGMDEGGREEGKVGRG